MGIVAGGLAGGPPVWSCWWLLVMHLLGFSSSFRSTWCAVWSGSTFLFLCINFSWTFSLFSEAVVGCLGHRPLSFLWPSVALSTSCALTLLHTSCFFWVWGLWSCCQLPFVYTWIQIWEYRSLVRFSRCNCHRKALCQSNKCVTGTHFINSEFELCLFSRAGPLLSIKKEKNFKN